MTQTSAIRLLSQWTAQVRTRRGVMLNVRPIAPDDRSAVLRFLQSITPDDLRFRFLTAVKPSEELARLLTEVDHRSVEDLVAFDSRDGAIAATAMIADGQEPKTAEIAVLVRSDLKDHGIGWEMLKQASDYARARGFRRVECVETSANVRAIDVEREQGFSERPDPGGADQTILSRTL